ncbi:Rieske (2Fe-2S) protein [Flavobacterium alkalisoli]|uniref:Rieske (2Fe-2S) protein n=1 Tax=Flavobacterium alkalisoli TaxID=2602769 RepID=UPI003A92ADFD
MRKYLLLLFAVVFLSSCSNDDYNNNNKYLPNYGFSINIDMNLPLYTPLLYTSNPVYIGQAGIGIRGIIVMNTGGGFVAYEASCPNQELSSCSTLDLNGINAVCPCDDVEYSLFTGLANNADVQYPLKPYRVEIISENVIRVYN